MHKRPRCVERGPSLCYYASGTLTDHAGRSQLNAHSLPQVKIPTRTIANPLPIITTPGPQSQYPDANVSGFLTYYRFGLPPRGAMLDLRFRLFSSLTSISPYFCRLLLFLLPRVSPQLVVRSLQNGPLLGWRWLRWDEVEDSEGIN